MGQIRRETVAVTGALTTNGAGTATANTTSGNIINGIIRAIHLTYVDSPPAGTTDVTVAMSTTPAATILTVTNGATDGWRYPMGAAVNTAGAAITNQGAPIPCDDYVIVTIAQANAGDGVTAVILYEK